jgi:hypothetical protein
MKKLFTALSLILLLIAPAFSQNWSSWNNIEYNNTTIQYSYKLFPVSSGNTFSMKLKNTSSSTVCGEFVLNLNMVKGPYKSSYIFKNLKPGVERICYGLVLLGDVVSISSITNVSITDCTEGISTIGPSPASFTVDFHNNAIKSGTFKYVDPNGQYSFETKAFSGLKSESNNPYFQSYRDLGLIPSGTWKIELITKPETPKQIKLNKNPPIFKLTPIKDVELSSSNSKEKRDGFLIHKGTNPLTASTGCIILDDESRLKLKSAILKYGPIQLKVENKVY